MGSRMCNKSKTSVVQASTIRRRVVELLNGEAIEIEDAGMKLGMLPHHVQEIWEKNAEVELATRFLSEVGAPVSEVQTLKEFLRVERDARNNMDIDHLSPDVVAQIAEKVVGIELTAYMDNEHHARLSAVMYGISEQLRKELSTDYPDLKDLILDYSPKTENFVSARNRRAFLVQLLEFVRLQHSKRAIAQGENRRVPLPNDRNQRNVFEDHDLLQKHVNSVSISRYPREYGIPVTVSAGGFATHIGISMEHLLEVIAKKTDQLTRAKLDRQDESWLLIHAAGWGGCSTIPALIPEEIKKLSCSSLSEAAAKSGYQRVVLWDGIHGGYIDFVSGDHRGFRQDE